MQTKDLCQTLGKSWDAMQVSLWTPRSICQFLKDPLNKIPSTQYPFVKCPTLPAPTEIRQRLPSPSCTSTKSTTLQVGTPTLTDSLREKGTIATAGFPHNLSKLTEDEIYGLPRSRNLTHYCAVPAPGVSI
jgi:hypothetical protein